MKRMLYQMIIVILLFSSFLFMNSPTKTSAVEIQPYGKLKPPSESFTPGDWFLGSTPPNYNSTRPPIVFVQGKNGSSTSWYGETEYHGINDMYTKAYEAGYQTVFVQLYDAAGNGSSSQYKNGRLLATKLAQISAHFGGKKVNIIAHSKGGPDTQAALVTYGAHPYVGRVITLASPHHGSNLADLANSWYAGWLASFLGANDEGTASLQIGEMAEFRSVIDNHANSRKNKYYTLTGTNQGPALSALSIGGLYLSSYGSNDGLVNDWSSKLPYGTHLFTDSKYDHDNIRTGSAVFSRIEPYLRSSSTAGVASLSEQPAEEEENISTTHNQIIHGGSLETNKWIEQSFSLNEATADGEVTIYTATADVETEMISPSGIVYSQSHVSQASKGETSFLGGAYVHTLKQSNMEAGNWVIRMKTNAKKDAYLLTAKIDDKEPLILEMPGKVKQKDAQFVLKSTAKSSLVTDLLTFDIHLTNEHGADIKNTGSISKFNSDTYFGDLPDVPESGIYNLTIDVKGKNTTGHAVNRTIVRSIYIEK
ncbi:esterase/lipase family protein [Peribacillus sp. NPDC097675]|uniref:esterase/lipase family protein n=1 Tax=Peribacillus sp. NPDC097675 TaxID=3390618 RepID=UPI003CFDD6FD